MQLLRGFVQGVVSLKLSVRLFQAKNWHNSCSMLDLGTAIDTWEFVLVHFIYFGFALRF